ncbi:MAG: hypothetical protein KAX38_02440, partial [Candidatus Krumholzibacteria bacterium]|nr:hypothetical protein [Candidatus Krumholzibacteria bacterium]
MKSYLLFALLVIFLCSVVIEGALYAGKKNIVIVESPPKKDNTCHVDDSTEASKRGYTPVMAESVGGMVDSILGSLGAGDCIDSLFI